MLSTPNQLRPYIANADEWGQELTNRFALLISTGHLNDIPQASKNLFDLVQRYRIATRVVDNHREADKLTLDDELEENQAQLALAQALFEFDSSNHVWFQ